MSLSNYGGRGVDAPIGDLGRRLIAGGAATALAFGGMLAFGGYPARASTRVPATTVRSCTYSALKTAVGEF